MADERDEDRNRDSTKEDQASMKEKEGSEVTSKSGHSQGKENNPGNFANDREKASAAGRKSGE